MPEKMPAMLASLDGAIMPAADAVVPATDEGLLRGDGVFEVVRIYGGRPFALEDHLARLERSAAGLRLPADLGAVREDVAALLAAADAGDAALRIVLTRGGRRLAIVEPLKALPATLTLETVTYAPTQVLTGIKSLSYGANMLAHRLAEEAGADEALLVSPQGHVLEGPTSGFFCSLDGRTLVTPPLEHGVLDSITRRRLLALGVGEERTVMREELAVVREAFLASTLREVHPVRAIDGAPLPAAPGPLTLAAAERMRDHVAAELAALA
jgi:branched-chain amino acid aminotransferase